MRYFQEHDWAKDWIAEARRLVTTVWQERYKPAPPKPPVRPRPVNPGRMHANVDPPVRGFFIINITGMLMTP